MLGIIVIGFIVFSGLDDMFLGIFIWCFLLYWLGGIGFIVMVVVILLMLWIGGMCLF